MEKTTILGNTEGSRKGGRPNIGWIDSIKEVIGVSPQVLSRADENRTLWISLIGSSKVGADPRHVITHIKKRQG